jgi:tryptophanyl-tRNA synthetase
MQEIARLLYQIVRASLKSFNYTWTFMNPQKKVSLTGDRPTGPLHLGHYIGSLKTRLELEKQYKQYIMIADVQALTDHSSDPKKVRDNVLEVALDYLGVGIDPEKSIIFIQSLIPELFELTTYFLNLVTWNRLKHNPTVKQEILQKGFGEAVPAGFMVYPISQAADITAFKADVVPVGEDQLPMIEQTNEIVRRFNQLYHTDVLKEVEALIPPISRLPGTDGKAKMSKTLGNCIYLSDSSEVISKKVKGMYTDPKHLRIEDPGETEGNPVFIYLDAFDPDQTSLEELKAHYRRGGLGDAVIKKRLEKVLQELLEPMRERRAHFSRDPEGIMEMLLAGSRLARAEAEETLHQVKSALFLNYENAF